MKPLTRKQKIALLEKTKEYILSDESYYKFMCWAIAIVSKRRMHSDDVFTYIPELIKYKPKKVSLHAPWFPYSWKQRRIKLINQVIKEIENKPRRNSVKKKDI